MSEENVTTTASSSRSKPYLKRLFNNLKSSILIKITKKSQEPNIKEENNGEDVNTKTMLLTDLPNEILGKILNQVSFDDLFTLEIVCKRLQNYVLNFVWPMKDSLTHESIIQYTNYPRIPPNSKSYQHRNTIKHKITIKSVKAVLSRANNIKYIDLSYYSFTLKLFSLPSMAPKLIKLDLAFISLKNSDLVNIAHSCPMLEEISLEDSFSYKDEYDNGLKTLCNECPNIKHMNLAGNTIGNFFNFLPIGLLYLNLDYCNITSNDMNLLAQRAPNLETLILDYSETYEPITDMNIWLSKLMKLRFLQIDSIFPLSPIPPLDFSNLQELEKLRLCSNELIDLSSLESLQNCSKLKSLDLSLNTLDINRTFEMLKKCSALKYCNFSEWSDMNEEIVDFIQHNQIEYLDLTLCDNLTYNLIKSLINDCESLNYLNILSQYINYGKILSSILSKNNTPPRKNILKIIVYQNTKITSSSSKCEWCKVIPWNYIDPQPFPDLTDLQIQ